MSRQAETRHRCEGESLNSDCEDHTRSISCQRDTRDVGHRGEFRQQEPGQGMRDAWVVNKRAVWRVTEADQEFASTHARRPTHNALAYASSGRRP